MTDAEIKDALEYARKCLSNYEAMNLCIQGTEFSDTFQKQTTAWHSIIRALNLLTWQPKELFETNGTQVIGWLSSEKGFQDRTRALIYFNDRWHWGGAEDPVKRPDLIHGVKPWPEPPTKEKQE